MCDNSHRRMILLIVVVAVDSALPLTGLVAEALFFIFLSAVLVPAERELNEIFVFSPETFRHI